MGIQGLLPLLKSIQRPTEIKKFAGETFGVDAYGWLHRGAISCAIELAQGKPARKYVDFAMHRVRMLKHFGVTPFLVFDGDFLPSKASTEASRAKRREESRKIGLELLKAGKPSQAHQELQKAIDVTPEMARHLIEALKKAGIPYVVAPYEADAQLVYLERQGITSGIISEDSDLLVFGAKRLITKLDQYGQCVEINRRDFGACREVSLVGWSDVLFRHMAILSGCDYLNSIPGFGLKTAHRMLRKHKTAERVVRMLQFEGKHRIPADYFTLFTQAEQTFLYQWAFCPTSKQLVNLTSVPDEISLDQLPFIGSYVEPELARRIASGDVNPITKQEIRIATLPSPRKRAASAIDRVAPQPQRPKDTPKKPIDSYFKGHQRIPLGEMDPNLFQPDLQRISNATEEETRPIVFPLPRPYIDTSDANNSTSSRNYINRPSGSPRVLRRRTEPVTNLLAQDGRSLASGSRRRTTGPEAQISILPDNDIATKSGTRPPKKARLCNDAATGLSPEKQKSKFFSSKGTRSSRASKSEGYLMSDDSIEDALRDLPDVDGWNAGPSRRRTISVYEGETSQKSRSSLNIPKDNETAPLSNSMQDSMEAIVPDTPPKSTLDRFAYEPEAGPRPSSRKPLRQSQRQSTMSNRSSMISLTPASTFSPPSTAQSTPATPRLTPLERLGIQAVGRGKASPTPAFAAPRRSQRSRSSLNELPTNPAFVPLPLVDVAEIEALNPSVGVGSEDLLVPDSEAEDADVAAASPEGKRACGPLDLSRFLFA
ncbi:hypothetical protein F5Y16DRAFT_260729 [Xylariaceae sp. FL0255]|nr:hypothetical protein F5Y16DRAFT_260729 [Xylariaceae sp. FL0255]